MSLHINNRLPYPVIRTVGIASIVFVAGLTGFTVKMAIDDANNRANGAYMSALSNIQVPDQRIPATEPPFEEQPTEPPVESVTTEPVVTEPIATEPVTTEAPVETSTDISTEEQVTEIPTDIPIEEPVTESSTEKHADTEEPAIDDIQTEEPPTDHQIPDRVDETPDDLGYDLTHVTVDQNDVVIYTIQPGDWLSRIGAAYGFTVPELAAANPYIKNVDLIFSGNPVVLPGDNKFVAYVKYYLSKNEQSAGNLPDNADKKTDDQAAKGQHES